MALAEGGRFVDALSEGEDAIRVAESLEHPPTHREGMLGARERPPLREALAIAHLSEAESLAGCTDEALASADRAVRLSRQRGERFHETHALLSLGRITSQHANREGAVAEEYFREALNLGEELGMRPVVAHCHLGLGKLYRRTGKREQAHEHLTTATTMYREMEMRFYLEQAEAELRSL